MELLGPSLSESLQNRLHQNGFSFYFIQKALHSLLNVLVIFKKLSLIHSDIKPENILQDLSNPDNFKLVDYSLATLITDHHYTYIQSRFYRSPEVLFDIEYTNKIDIWSLGCVAAELFFGLPIFPAKSEKHLVYLIDQLVGPIPQTLIEKANKRCFFTTDNHLKSLSELNFGLSEIIEQDHPFFVYNTLEDNFFAYRQVPTIEYAEQITNNIDDLGNPINRELITIDLSPEEIQNRKMLLDLIQKMLTLDYNHRPEAEELLNHPFMLAQFPNE